MEFKKLLILTVLSVCMAGNVKENNVVPHTKFTTNTVKFVGALCQFEVLGCTGVLISDRWVLTTASCIDEFALDRFYIGVRDIEDTFEWPDLMIQHPKYPVALADEDLSNLINYDIALIKLIQPVNSTKNIQIAKLELEPWPRDVNNQMVTKNCMTIGESIKNKDVFQQHQNSFKIKISEKDCECASITHASVCTKIDQGMKMCANKEDRGSPLLCDGKVTGIVVSSHECTKGTKPSGCQNEAKLYFNFLYDHLGWIKEQMEFMHDEESLSSWKRAVAVNTIASMKLICFSIMLFKIIKFV